MRRVRKRFKPPERSHTAIKRMEDGREICLQNDAGRHEYKQRKMRCWQRQSGLCSICHLPLSLVECTFEHAMGRTAGHRDDRIINEKGEPLNSVCHKICNSRKGSRHFQPPIPRGFDPDSANMGAGGSADQRSGGIALRDAGL